MHPPKTTKVVEHLLGDITWLGKLRLYAAFFQRANDGFFPSQQRYRQVTVLKLSPKNPSLTSDNNVIPANKG